MRKIQILGVAFFAVLAFGVVSAASAMAETPQWLEDGKAITTAKPSLTEGKLLFLVLGLLGGTIHFVCSGKFHGTVGPGMLDKITDVLNLVDNKLNEISCELLHTQLGACSGSLLIIVKPVHLPWHTLLLEPKANEFVDHILEEGTAGLPGYESDCTTAFGTKAKETCEGEVLVDTRNGPSGLEGEFLNQLSAKCGTGGVTSHLTSVGAGITKLENGKALTVSK